MIKKLLKSHKRKLQYIPLDEPANYFYTFDLGCSAALICKKFQLTSLDKENPKKVQFIFQKEPGIEKVVNEYWANTLEVKAREFFDSVKMLKNRIYSE
jgi:hypothetical protein